MPENPSPPTPSSRQPLLLAGLIALSLLAAALRVWQIRESLWVDELHTAWCVQGGISEVAPRATMGNQSPLYFYLVWLVTRVLGESQWTLRLLSLLAGSALPAAVYLLVRKMWRQGISRPGEDYDQSGQAGDDSLAAALEARDWSSLLAAFLVAVDYPAIFYGSEARPYACVQLLAVIAVWLLVDLLDKPNRTLRIAWVLVSWALFYLHPTTGLFIAAMAVCRLFAALRKRDSTGESFAGVLLDLLLFSVGTLPALPLLLTIAQRRQNWAAFIEIPSRTDILFVFPWMGLVMALWINSLLERLFASRASRVGSGSQPPALRLEPRYFPALAAIALLPLAIAWGLTRWDIVRLFHPRYLVAILPISLACVAIGTQFPRNRWFRKGVVLLVAIIYFWQSGIVDNVRSEWRFVTERNEDWPTAIEVVNQHLQNHPSMPVLIDSGLMETAELREHPTEALRQYALLPVKSLYPVQCPDEQLVALPFGDAIRLDPRVLAQAQAGGGLLLVVRGSPERGAELLSLVKGDLREALSVSPVAGISSHGNLQVYFLPLAAPHGF